MVIYVGDKEQYKSIQAAIDAIKDDKVKHIIYLKEGIYHEKVVISKNNVRLIGENLENTIIKFNDSAKKLDDKERTLGTFRTYTILVIANNVFIENLTIINESGSGDVVGQAVALFVNGDKTYIKNCKIIGAQDTLLTGPIPSDAKNQEYLDFIIEHKKLYKQLYENCTIQGDVDFIFGSANAIFKECNIISNDLKKNINGYISAASTEQNHFGHIFISCKLLSNSTSQTVYLGRPWREYANTVYLNCYMGPHIKNEGFAKWGETIKHLTARYYEYQSYGPGSLRNENSLSVKLSDSEAKLYYDLLKEWK